MNALPLDLLNHVFAYSNRMVVSDRLGKSQVDGLYDDYLKTISAQPNTLLHRELVQIDPALPSAKRVQGAICGALERIKKDRRFLPLWAQSSPPGKFDFSAINKQGELIEEARNVNLLKFVYGLRSQHPSAVQFTQENEITDEDFSKDHQEKALLAAEWLRVNEGVIFGENEEEKRTRVYSFLSRNKPVSKEYINIVTLPQQKGLLQTSVIHGSTDAINALIDADTFQQVPVPILEKTLSTACLGNPVPPWRESVAGSLIHSGRLDEIPMDKIQKLLVQTNSRTFELLLGALIVSGRFQEIDWKALGMRFNEALRWTVCWGHVSEFYALLKNDQMSQVGVDDLYMTLAAGVYGGHGRVVATLTNLKKSKGIEKKLLGNLLETAATFGYAEIALRLFEFGKLPQTALLKAIIGAAKSGKNGTIKILIQHVKFSDVSVNVLGEAIWSAVGWGNGEGLKIIIRNLDKAKLSLKEIVNHENNSTKEQLFALLKDSSLKDVDVLNAVKVFRAAYEPEI